MKKLTAKVGEYERDGVTKGRYVNLGVVMSNDNGEYILLDPSVSIAGVYAQQSALAASKGEQARDRVMVGIWEDDDQQPAPQQSAPQQQAPKSKSYANEIAKYRSFTNQQQAQAYFDGMPQDVKDAIIADFNNG